MHFDVMIEQLDHQKYNIPTMVTIAKCGEKSTRTNIVVNNETQYPIKIKPGEVLGYARSVVSVEPIKQEDTTSADEPPVQLKNLKCGDLDFDLTDSDVAQPSRNRHESRIPPFLPMDFVWKPAWLYGTGPTSRSRTTRKKDPTQLPSCPPTRLGTLGRFRLDSLAAAPRCSPGSPGAPCTRILPPRKISSVMG